VGEILGARGRRAEEKLDISLAIPSTFHNFVTADTIQHEQYVNLAVAVALLATYGLSLVFMLQTHPISLRAQERRPNMGPE